MNTLDWMWELRKVASCVDLRLMVILGTTSEKFGPAAAITHTCAGCEEVANMALQVSGLEQIVDGRVARISRKVKGSPWMSTQASITIKSCASRRRARGRRTRKIGDRASQHPCRG
jgi:hypothetical protein